MFPSLRAASLGKNRRQGPNQHSQAVKVLWGQTEVKGETLSPGLTASACTELRLGNEARGGRVWIFRLIAVLVRVRRENFTSVWAVWENIGAEKRCEEHKGKQPRASDLHDSNEEKSSPTTNTVGPGVSYIKSVFFFSSLCLWQPCLLSAVVLWVSSKLRKPE